MDVCVHRSIFHVTERYYIAKDCRIIYFFWWCLVLVTIRVKRRQNLFIFYNFTFLTMVLTVFDYYNQAKVVKAWAYSCIQNVRD